MKSQLGSRKSGWWRTDRAVGYGFTGWALHKSRKRHSLHPVVPVVPRGYETGRARELRLERSSSPIITEINASSAPLSLSVFALGTQREACHPG